MSIQKGIEWKAIDGSSQKRRAQSILLHERNGDQARPWRSSCRDEQLDRAQAERGEHW